MIKFPDCDFKIIVNTPEKSARFQDRAFKQGIFWINSDENKIINTDKQCLFIRGTLITHNESDFRYFRGENIPEVFYDKLFADNWRDIMKDAE